jgi:hypothetical protein
LKHCGSNSNETVLFTLAAALAIMHFRVKAQGFSLNLKTKAFVLNLVLLVIYSVSVGVFYTELYHVYLHFQFMVQQEDSVIMCWLIKNITGFICFSYLSYVVMVQFGRGNKVNLSEKAPLEVDDSERTE